MNIYQNSWVRMLSVQLFEIPIISSDCWLTLAFGLNQNHTLFSQYNPKILRYSHQLIWASLAQQTVYKQSFYIKSFIFHIKQLVFTLNQLNLVLFNIFFNRKISCANSIYLFTHVVHFMILFSHFGNITLSMATSLWPTKVLGIVKKYH